MSSTPEAELRLAEQEHRMANTFQLIGAVLARAAADAPDAASALAFHKADAQLRAFVLVHEAVRLQDEPGETICAAAYLRGLCEHLRAAFLEARGVSLHLEADAAAPLPERTCRTLGLILTELVLNAAKHAFQGRSGGEVVVVLSGGPHSWRLRVADDGCGLPASSIGRRGRGLEFVDALARGVGARVVREPCERGARFLCEAA